MQIESFSPFRVTALFRTLLSGGRNGDHNHRVGSSAVAGAGRDRGDPGLPAAQAGRAGHSSRACFPRNIVGSKGYERNLRTFRIVALATLLADACSSLREN